MPIAKILLGVLPNSTVFALLLPPPSGRTGFLFFCYYKEKKRVETTDNYLLDDRYCLLLSCQFASSLFTRVDGLHFSWFQKLKNTQQNYFFIVIIYLKGI